MAQKDDSYATARKVALVSAAIIGCCVALVLVVRLLGLVGPALELLLVGVVLGFICSPITNWLEDHGIGRALAAFIALAIVILALVGLAVIVVPPFIQQLLSLLQTIPTYIQQLQEQFTQLMGKYTTTDNADAQYMLSQGVNALSSVGSTFAQDLLTKISNGLLTNAMTTVNNIVTFFLGLVLAYWFAKDYPVMVRECAVIVGERHEQSVTLMLAVMSRSMGGYMRSMVTTSIVNGVLATAGLAAFGHPYAGLVGVFTGVAHFIPVIGPFVSAAFAVLLGLFQSPLLALETLIVMVIAQNVTDNLLSPLVMQSAVQVHPVLSLICIIMGSALGGVLGMILAVPLTAAIKGVFVYYFESRTGRQLVTYDGAIFKGTPYVDDEGNIVPSFDALDDDRFFETSRLVKAMPHPVAPKGGPSSRTSVTHASAPHSGDTSGNDNM
ncbi:MAG: AI-2E family transporter [Atopobiaceae bacterium]